MSKKRTKPPLSRSAQRAAKPDFHRQTVLFQWALAKFGVRDLKEFRERFDVGPERDEAAASGRAAEGSGRAANEGGMAGMISSRLPATTGDTLSLERLREYDQNIAEDTSAMNAARSRHGQRPIEWKYHQYLALLFTEMFLDHYFGDAEGLRAEINERIRVHNESANEADRIPTFPTEPVEGDTAEPSRQLAMLAFWCATGSGKTLLMHMHIRQFRRRHAAAFKAGRWPPIAQIILVTPNEGLTLQHATELEHAGFKPLTEADAMNATLYASGGDGLAVKVIDIHKFRDERGDKTVATEAFEGCNLVLVDEGHRGAGRGEDGKWMERRNQLAKDGFCFEYSATFKEAIAGDDRMRDRYARSVLFDYAYRSFYRDGYGKDFTILNLEEEDEAKRKQYLTAALLLFYQQLRVWMDGGEAIKPFMVDKPLWVFVGHTVAGKASSKDDKEVVSDVVDILLFLRDFLKDDAGSRSMLESLVREGFTDQKGRNLLANRLTHLEAMPDAGDKAALARKVHEGILREVFNAPSGGALAVQLMKGADGELALRIGEAEPFGVVNVGDPATVAEACAEKGITKLEDDLSRASLFQRINRDDSPINMLIGSRKFTEGWNSWRVSSIGLMRMGKSEGTQIIQLFGRGVRLRGYRMGLRRSSVLSEKPTPPKNLRQVETLQVFGVKATYMNQFRDWIYEEVPEAKEKEIWDLPVVKTLPERKLKTIRLKEVIEGERVERGQAFRRLGPLVVLRPPTEGDAKDDWLRRNRVRVNWMPRIRGLVGKDKAVTAAVADAGQLPTQSLKKVPVLFLDVDALLFGLEAFKATRGLDRLHVDRAAIHALLVDESWYELFASAETMRLDRPENRDQWQRVAQQLLNQYAEKFYRYLRSRWEAPYIEVADMTEEDPNLLAGYTIETTELVGTAEDIERIAGFVKDLRKALEKDATAAWSQYESRWRTVPFGGHLYQPLMFVGKNMEIRILPVALDRYEAQFVEDLAKWCRENKGAEVYLLRNQAVTGLGFFQAANYYPDFLLWMQDGDRQHLAFVDPKGLHHHDPSDPKVRFATEEVPRLQKIIEAESRDLALHAFIISNTEFAKLDWSDGPVRMTREQVEALGVLFQVDDATDYVGKMMGEIRSETIARKA